MLRGTSARRALSVGSARCICPSHARHLRASYRCPGDARDRRHRLARLHGAAAMALPQPRADGGPSSDAFEAQGRKLLEGLRGPWVWPALRMPQRRRRTRPACAGRACQRAPRGLAARCGSPSAGLGGGHDELRARRACSGSGDGVAVCRGELPYDVARRTARNHRNRPYGRMRGGPVGPAPRSRGVCSTSARTLAEWTRARCENACG